MRFPGRISSTLLAACLLTAVVQSFAQYVINCRQLTTDDGLSENVVYCMLQDKRGFIWAGTDFGLNQFDGYSFRKFYKNNYDSTSLSNNAVTCLAEGADGKIWIGTMDGLNVYDPATGRVNRVFVRDKKFRDISDILITGSGQLFISAGGVLYSYTPGKGELNYLSKKLKADAWGRFFKMPRGKTAISAFHNNEWWLLISENNSLKWELVSADKEIPFVKGQVLYYGFDNSGFQYLQLQGTDYLQVLDRTGNKVLHFTGVNEKLPIGFRIYNIRETGAGLTWIATSNGLYIYDHAKNQISRAELRTGRNNMPSDIQYRCILTDRNGNTWLGCFPGGVLQCETRSSPFRHIAFPGNNRQRLGILVMSMSKWNEKSIAAHAGDIYIFKEGKLTGKRGMKDLSAEENILIQQGLPALSFSRQQQEIYDGIRKRFPFSERLFLYFPVGDSLLVRFNEAYNIYLHSPQNSRVIYETAGFMDVSISDSSYWIATTKGLIRIDRRHLKDTLYQFDPGNTNSLSESWLYCAELIGDDLWIGTKGGGLNRFNLRENKFYHYKTAVGLPDNAVYTVVPDNLGNLWLSTNNGLSRFTPATGTFVNFSRRDGLLNSEFNRRSGVMGDDGYLYFGGIDGIDYFRPEDIVLDSTRPVVHFSRLLVNGKEGQLVPGSRLRHNSNNLTVYFTTNDFTRPELIYFRYRLKEKDSWGFLRGTNALSLDGLAHGRYRFEIQASNNNHTWGDSAVIAFTIATPWWRSVWLYIGAAFLAVAVIYILYRYRIRHYKKLLAIRNKISKDLHDEVGATLSSIHIYSSVASKAMDSDKQKSQDALRHIHENTKQVMENLNDIVWAVKGGAKEEYSLEEKLKNYGYELLTPLNIRCEYRVDKEAEKLISGMEARRNILLIAKEAMNNIAKYSGATSAFVELKAKGKNLELEISDNGKGIDAANGRRGNGLQHMQERGKTLGGDLQVLSAPGGGTSVVCSFPMTNISDA